MSEGEGVLKLTGKMVEVILDTKGSAMYDKEYSILRVLMDRDGLSRTEAEDLLREARWEVANGADPEEVCAEEFGLEPDYIFDLIGGLK